MFTLCFPYVGVSHPKSKKLKTSTNMRHQCTSDPNSYTAQAQIHGYDLASTPRRPGTNDRPGRA